MSSANSRSANSRSATVSIALTAVVLILASQGMRFVSLFVRRLSGGPAQEGTALTMAIPLFSLMAMALAALIMGGWLRARHANALGVAFLAALATGVLNGMANYFVGHDPNLTAVLQNAPAQPAVLIGVVIGGLAVVLILWLVLLTGGLIAGLFRSKRAA